MSIMRAQLPRELYAGGGITQVRQPYFLGKAVRAVKKIAKPIKKVVSSPLGKAALLGAGIYGLGGGTFFGKTLPGLAQAGGFKMGNLTPNLMNYLVGQPGRDLGIAGGQRYMKPTQGILGSGGKFSPWRSIAAASTLPFLAPKVDEETTEFAEDVIDRGKFDFDFAEMRKDIAQAVRGGNYDEFKAVLDKYDLVEGVDINKWGDLQTGALAKDGGRIGMQEGGIMDLGGMEKDYRNTGGFVEIGGKERADDVPARLSKNEFVFTADAVRSAGGGDIDQGAEIMENVMKNLEAGGKISEESQGMRGAQEMFDVSERLSEVV